MRAATIGVVAVGLTLALALGIDQGFDPTSVAILILIALVGALAVAAVNRSSAGVTAPAVCACCAGVISANAPYCKHCGAPAPPE